MKKKIREAAMGGFDNEDYGWTKLTGDDGRDLTPFDQSRMQEVARWLWESNLLANRIIELPVAYILGEGVKLSSSDDAAQEVLDQFWTDPINSMSLFCDEMLRELQVFGELCLGVFVNEMNGFVRLGYIDPSEIAEIIYDPDNRRKAIGVVKKRDPKTGKTARYQVIYNAPDNEIFADRAQEIRAQFTDGQCFYWKINALIRQKRGRSDLASGADWIDAYENFLFGEVDRANFLRAFIWDVTISGATEDDIKKWERRLGSPPRPGSVRVHNESVAWKAESPDLNSADSDSAARLFRNHVLGGYTYPEHWYGGGGDVNRSTADSMGEPTFKMLSKKQMQFGFILSDIGRFVLNSAGLYEADVYVNWPELTAKDIAKHSAAFQQVVASVQVALMNSLISKKTALELIALVAARMGLEIDTDQELSDAAAEMQDTEADDASYPNVQSEDDMPIDIK
jgi:hypothetical protein